MTKQTHDMVMTIDDLATYLKLSTSTLYKLCAEGKVPGQKVGRHWRFHRMVIDEWIGFTPNRAMNVPIVPSTNGRAAEGSSTPAQAISSETAQSAHSTPQPGKRQGGRKGTSPRQSPTHAAKNGANEHEKP